MTLGLFAMLAGFLLPLSLVIRLVGMLAAERGRSWGHPLSLVLLVMLLLACVPVVALAPAAWNVVSGTSIEAGKMILDFTTTEWGLARLFVNVVAVLLADAAMPRIYDQLVLEPSSTTLPTRDYLLRDLGVLATCLTLAGFAAAMHA